jgi:prepilin-type N-terminal cleavage/methylation domain-containing protein
MRHMAGFTLLEVLLSVLIISLLAGIGAPIYETFVRRNDLDITTQSVADAIRRAETYARGNNGDSVWSVEFQPTVVTLFKGTTFSGRDTSYDETISLPGSISFAGLSEIQFAKLSGAPNNTGTLTYISTTNDTRVITVNAKGMVAY